MVEKHTLKGRLFHYFFSEEVEQLETEKKNLEKKINQKVAEIVAKLDPLAPLLAKHNILFSREYERVEDSLDPRSQVQMYMWGYQQYNDPCFKKLSNWVIDFYGNEMAKKSNPTPETIFFNRAQMSAAILWKKEIKRLSRLYEDYIKGSEDFDEFSPLEED